MSVTDISLLEDLQGSWSTLTVQLIGSEAPVTKAFNVFPFTSVSDLKRMIWYESSQISQSSQSRFAPERVFLCVAAPNNSYRPLEFQWPTTSIDLPDPLPVENRVPSPLLVDESGNRKPITAVMTAGLTLEAALSPEMLAAGLTEPPQIIAISLAALQPEKPEDVTPALLNGFYQLYFPWLQTVSQVLDATATVMSARDREALAAAAPYLEDRAGRIGIVQAALAAHVAGPTATLTSFTQLRWTLPPPSSRPTSLEKTFYGLTATKAIPFLRFFPVAGKGAPLLKLALKPDGGPVLDDDKMYAQFLGQPAPNTTGAVIVARVPLATRQAERAAFTIHMFDDGTSDVILEVPQRGVVYTAAVATDAERILRELLPTIGFPPESAPMLQGLNATYRWSHPNPEKAAPITATTLQKRVAALTPFLVGTAEPRQFKWRAVSNYESESAQFAFITQLVLGDEGEGEGHEALMQYAAALAERFGLTPAVAAATLDRWAERRSETVAAGVPKHNTGAVITVGGTHPEYSIEIQGASSVTEVQRILSVVGVVLGASTAELRLQAPAPVVTAVAEAVELADAVVAAAVEPEMDLAEADLLGDIDFGFGEDEDEEGEGEGAEGGGAVPPPALAVAELGAPDIDAVAAEEGECQGRRWTAGEAPVALSDKYYMLRLKSSEFGDPRLFGYSTKLGGKVKGYSKTCQREDERQPNIMTLNEYARVRRCYKDQVRFVNLPPKSPADLPVVPDYDPRKSYSAEFFMTDPETGRPLWTVYGYESKTAPGQYRYLICAELWCVHEGCNLPLTRAEFEGTVGRGFSKDPRTCPFCGGRPIAVFNAPASGESVIVREAKGKTHSFIGEITLSNKHPEGFPLPCCYATPRFLEQFLKEQAAGTLVYGKPLAAAEATGAAAEEDAEPPPELAGAEEVDVVDIDYARILGTLPKYILGGDKVLGAGKIGLLPPALEAFFGQDSSRAVKRVSTTTPQLVKGAALFARLGVDNNLRTPGLNLFAALAPLMGYHSAAHARRELTGKHFVRAFESANYGSLVIEFAARSTLTEPEIASSLAAFAGEYGYDLGPNRAHVARLYKAWVAYITYLSDRMVPKQLRHLEHLIAQPGVFTPTGLLFVTLDWDRVKESIEIVCPSFGIPNASVFGDVPIAFLWHNRQDDSWEPLILYNGSDAAMYKISERLGDVARLPQPMRGSLQKWLREWRSSSNGCGRPAPPPHVWTPDRDTLTMPRLSQMRETATRLGAELVKLVRDRSNRLAGVLVLAGANTLFVPCLDDGALMDQLPRVFEVDAIPPVALDEYLTFYTALSAIYPSMKPVAALAKLDDATQIMAFRTEVETMVPVAPTPLSATTLPVDQIDAAPWERDALILKAPDAPVMAGTGALEETTASPEEQLAEAYQHLRLSVSHWLARNPEQRADLAALIKSELPLYEKRKRLDIMLEPHIREWIAPVQTEERKSLALLRQDCLTITEETACADACSWSGGRCMIHAPFRKAGTEPVRIFTARLSDEILRYSAARREIFEETVPAIRTPRGILRVGDELYMATKPKESAAMIMARLGFVGEQAMVFPEELLRFEGLEEEDAVAEAEAVEVQELPKAWLELGLTLPVPAPTLSFDEARRLAFAGSTGKAFEEWEANVKLRRKALTLPGDPDRPFQWSVQDFYVIARLATSNVLFIHAEPTKLVIDRWIGPPPVPGVTSKKFYMILWGPKQLLLSKGLGYRFRDTDLPGLVDALEVASPMEDAEARGVDEPALPLPLPLSLVPEAGADADADAV